MGKRFVGLGKDILTYGVMTGVSRMAGFLLLPIFTRVFSIEQYGAYDIIATFATLATTIAGVSLPSAIVRYFFDYDAERRDRLISTSFGFVFVVAAIILLLGSLLAEPLAGWILDQREQSSLIVLGLVSVVFSAAGSVPLIVLRMKRQIVRFNLANLLHSAGFAGFSLYFVLVRSFGVRGVLWAMILAAVLKFAVSAVWVRQHLTWRISMPELYRALRYSLPLLPGTVVTWINKQADRLFLLWLVGLSAVGVFGAAARIAMSISLLTTIFRRAWSPYAMSLIDAPADERNAFYRRALNYYAGLFAILGLTVTALSPELFRIVVGPDYYQGYVLVPWLVGAAVLHAAGSITVIGVLLSEKTIMNTIAAWSGAAINILLAVILIPRFELQGAVIGSFVAELVFAGLLWRYTVRCSSVRFDRSAVLMTLITYVAGSVAILWVAAATQDSLLSISARLLIATGGSALIAWRTIDRSPQRLVRSVVAQLPTRAAGGASR